MTASKLSDLLPIPAGVADPHAYQVFGLTGVESSSVIKAAVKDVYAGLKAAKQTTDPTLWKKAAKLAESAKATLSDPDSRAELNSQFSMGAQMVAPPTGAPPSGSPPTGVPRMGVAADPLSGMLPAADPLAGMLPPTNPMAAPASPGTASPGTHPPAPLHPGPAVPPGAPTPTLQSPTAPHPPGMPQPGYPLQPVTPQSTQGQPGYPQPGYPQPGYAQPGYQQPAYPQPTGQPAVYPQPGQVAYPPNYGQPQAAGSIPAAPGHAVTAPAPAAPTGPVLKTKKSKKRRKSKGGIGFFVASAVVLAAAIAGLAAFLMSGSGVSISKDGDLSIAKSGVSQGAPPQQSAVPKTDRGKRRKPVREKKKPADPVMGDMAGEVEPPPPMTSTGLPVNQFSPPQMGEADPTGMQDPAMDGPMSLESPDIPGVSDMVKPGVVEPAPIDPDVMLPITPPTDTPSSKMSDADVTKADATIEKVKQLIRDADWVKMKPAAEQLTEMTLSPEQRSEADALYNLADLATYYRGALQRGLGGLQATQDFEVADGFRVIVVSVSASSITILFNKRNKTYSVDELPFRLGEKIASFALSPDKPDSIAGKNAYQAISKLATAEHRTEAIEWLTMMDGDVDQVDTKAVAEMIKTLFK